MPRLQVDSERPIALPSLVDILCRVIKHLQHRHDARRLSVGALDAGTTSADVVDRQPNTARPLGDLRTLTQRFIDALDGILLHVDQKARRQLSVVRARVEQGGGRVDKVPLRQRIVGLLDTRNITTMELNSHAHPHVLRALPRATVAALQQVPPLQRLIAEVVKHEITRVVDHVLNRQILRDAVVGVAHNALIKQHLRRINQTGRSVLMVVVNQDTGCQLPVIRVIPRLHHRTRLGRKLVQLGRLDAVLNLVTDLLRDQIRVHMLKSVGEALQASQHLVERHRNARAIALCDVKMVSH